MRATQTLCCVGGRLCADQGALSRFSLPAPLREACKTVPLLITPGFVDVHVHLRQPGFSYKETIETGTKAAARGGYVSVCAMPNIAPAPDCMENLSQELDIIKKDAVVPVYAYGAITKNRAGRGELSDIAGMAGSVIGYSDDGTGVQDKGLMREAMQEIKKTGRVLCAHCEDETLLQKGGCVHDGAYARAHHLVGISSASEWKQLARDLDLCAQTGVKYHACHISCRESVALVRQAKKGGLNVSCETAPHYLLLCQDDLMNDGRFKMNPPLRARDDRDALREGLIDGTIDIIATDHAPHGAQEKAGGLRDSLMGVVGLECAFMALYAGLCETEIIPLDIIVRTLTDAPRARFGIPDDGACAVFDLSAESRIDSRTFLSMGRATPFDGRSARGACIYTSIKGETVWASDNW